MGWWTQNEEGHSFADVDNPHARVWGDGPADLVDEAINGVVLMFLHEAGRLPSIQEVVAGLKFSTNALALPATVEEAEQDTRLTDEQRAIIETHYYPATGGDRAPDSSRPDRQMAMKAIGVVLGPLKKPYQDRRDAEIAALYAEAQEETDD